MGLTVHFEVLNQLGTPMLYSDTLALRPAAGITGRIFYRTDSPFGIYRDNGVTWDLISSVGTSGAVTGSGVATRVAYWDTTSSISSNANLYFDATNNRLGIGTSTPSTALDVLGTITDNNTVTGITGLVTTATPNSSFSNNFTFNSGISTVASLNVIGVDVDNNLNYSGANTINSTSFNAAGLLRNIITFGAAAASITYTQATGIRALSNEQSIYIQSGANSGTISHYANLQIFGDQKLGAGLTTFTNRYQVLLNDYAEFSAGNTYTNRWAIYQSGASNTNYFNGKIITGSSTTISTYQLDVTGTTRVSGEVELNSTSGNTQIGTSGRAFKLAVAGKIRVTASNVWTANSGTALDVDGTSFFTDNIGITNNKSIFWSSVSCGIQASGSTLTLRSNTGTGASLFLDTLNSMVLGNGQTAADTSSIFDITSTTKGFLPPRMTTAQKNAIATPSAGLMIFDTTLAKLCVYSGAAWQTITSV